MSELPSAGRASSNFFLMATTRGCRCAARDLRGMAAVRGKQGQRPKRGRNPARMTPPPPRKTKPPQGAEHTDKEETRTPRVSMSRRLPCPVPCFPCCGSLRFAAGAALPPGCPHLGSNSWFPWGTCSFFSRHVVSSGERWGTCSFLREQLHMAATSTNSTAAASLALSRLPDCLARDVWS